MESLRRAASELSIPERMPRRAASEGLVHGERISPRRFRITFREEYDIAQTSDGSWQARVVSYFYTLEHEGAELITYHWHPRGVSPITGPHMHVRADIQMGDRWLGKVHLPTGVIQLEHVVALAIQELGAEPLRDDWQSVIDDRRQ